MKKIQVILISLFLVFVPHLGQAATPYEIYPVQAVNDAKLLPTTYPLPGSPSNTLSVTACRGEYRAASLAIYANQPISNLVLTATDLVAETATIPATAVDIKVVKCWFQAGVTYYNEGTFVLTPELLLKDDKLVTVDYQAPANYLRTFTDTNTQTYVCISTPTDGADLYNLKPQDADTLQPVDIDVGTLKQFWFTMHVPENAAPGSYVGKITLNAANVPPSEITLNLTVLPFSLEKPALKYGVWYRGILSTPFTLEYHAALHNDGKGVLNSDVKTPQQYLAEMVNIKNHGVDFPTLRNSGINFIVDGTSVVQQELSLRQLAGLTNGPLFASGASFGNPPPQTDTELQAYKDVVSQFLNVAKSNGYSDLYCYEGIDEAWGDQLTSERPAFQAIHEAGAKVFIATWWPETFELVGDLVDVCIYGGNPNGTLAPWEAPKWHSVGHQLFAYGIPSADVETPETFRRNYGLTLWKAGYDGAMPYSFQSSVKNIWNDFDDQFRDPAFTYPTVNGVIDTIQWEAFREGVNDVRYLTTLIKAIQNADPGKLDVALNAQVWLNSLDPSGDLDALRAQMIDWILQIQPTQQIVAPPAQEPPPSISPTSQSFSSDGGSGSITVSAAATYSWTAVNNDSWITIDQVTANQGNGTVYYSVALNTADTPRQGTITVAGQQFTISQDAAVVAPVEVKLIKKAPPGLAKKK